MCLELCFIIKWNIKLYLVKKTGFTPEEMPRTVKSRIHCLSENSENTALQTKWLRWQTIPVLNC